MNSALTIKTSGNMPGRKKELRSSEKEVELPAIGGRQLSRRSVEEKSWYYFISMITRILTILAFGWKKFYAQNCVRSKFSSWRTLRFINPIVSTESSKMSAVNCSICRPIRRTLTPSGTTELGWTINFPIFGVMLPICMTHFLSLLTLAIGLL
jgi:hypothetical protein